MSQVLKLVGAMGAAPTGGNQSLYDIISGLGLTTNLQLCLDAGDSASYDPGVQTAKWLDTSGNGFDFYRGSSAGGDAGEPTFNGSAGGLSSAEYFSFDGGDYFEYDTTNEAWMETLHKNSALFSLFAVFYPVDHTVAQAIFSTRGANNGINFTEGISDAMQIAVFSPTSQTSAITSTGTVNHGAWNVCTMVVDEAGAAGGCNLNGSDNTFDPTYSGPGTGSTGATACIGRRPTGALYLQNTWRLACFAAWQGTALTSTNRADLWNAIKGRFGL